MNDNLSDMITRFTIACEQDRVRILDDIRDTRNKQEQCTERFEARIKESEDSHLKDVRELREAISNLKTAVVALSIVISFMGGKWALQALNILP